MTKRISLVGRKRSSELAETSVEMKKAELMALQSNEESAVQTELVAEAEEFRPQPQINVAQEQTEPQNAAAKHLDEVRNLVAKLHAMVQQFEAAGSVHRRDYSILAQHKALVAEIKKALQEKASSQAQAGMDEKRNMHICQAFVDDVLVGLARVGVKLNPLQVNKVRKKQH
ncbi:MAG: hypothetical protein K0S29_553 [Gammaproteobacteria bacterium]|jgi:hypothetical protein|nr:hypothetical protein [Gammaproteobacteria bacterium]